MLVDLSRLVADMVERAIERQRDMVVVGRVASLDALLSLAGSTEPDVVVVVGRDGDELSHDCVKVLLERPRVKVLGIEAHEGRAYLYEQVDLGEVSPDRVVDTIREAARRPTPR